MAKSDLSRLPPSPGAVPWLVIQHGENHRLLTSPPRSSICGSSSSSITSTGDDSMVYILYFGGGSLYILIYCHPGEKQWRKYEYAEGDRDFKSMLHCKGKLYIVGRYGQILEITPNSGTTDIDEDSTSKMDTDEDSIIWSEIAGGLRYRFHSYYMESFGEVIKIDKHYIGRGDHEHFVTKILVSRLDFNSLTWEEVKFPSDHVFFIGYFNTDTRLSFLASELGNLLKGGCVYFTLKCDLNMYKYDLDDESVSLSSPCPDIPTPWLSPSWLRIPIYSRVDDSRTTTDLMLGKDEDVEKAIKETDCKTSTVDKDGEIKDVEEVGLLVKLNDDIVWDMSKFLHRVDRIHLRAVSKKYRSVIDLRRYSPPRTVHTTHISPWMIFPKNDRSILNFVNPMHNNENYLLSTPELLKGSRIRFSKGGWLLMAKRKILFFYNSFTKSVVRLPNMPDPNFTGISFSSLPTSSDCLVFAIDKELIVDQVRIFFIKRGDENWSYYLYNNVYLLPNKINMKFKLTINNPVFYHGRFYCLDNNGALGVFNHEHPNMSWEILSMIPPPNCGFIYNSYLVDCEGELLSVLLGRLGNWVCIYILNETEMVWIEVKHLGQYMLFLSSTSCISAIAPTSQMENNIYFPRLHNEGILYYSLDTGMYHSVGSCHSAKDFRDSKERLHCSWIEPNWSDISDHHLDWLNI
uniref:F-box/kelch-repeat protein n=1 Tax=Papaver somniferum TaxID=3469 RepID=A0A5B7LJQ1_PAPSO|nr:f-box/kelch-repeat protein [Papaver somniferum]